MNGMTLSEELIWRGFFNQTTLKDIKELDGPKLSFYFGVDPSAFGMQIGNLAAAMMVRHFINYGHKAYLLVGGATGLIGDPDGKDKAREQKSFETINTNKQEIARQYRQIFGGEKFTIVDNYDWFKDFGYLDFLRTVGFNVPLNQMLGREFVQSRISETGAGLSYAEFSYALIQAYDFLHLYQQHGVTLQLCGADQWGNSVAGVDLIRRIERQEAHVYACPLILNKTTGKKFGKSEDGAVWLNADSTSAYRFYQFWLNVDDLGVVDYLKIFTLLDKPAIDKLEQATLEAPEQRLAQKALAQEVTKMVHGLERFESVRRVTDVLFGGASFEALNSTDLAVLAKEIPTVSKSLSLIEALVQTGVAKSAGEAKRLLKASAVAINGQKTTEDTVLNKVCLIKKGKNSFILAQ